MKTARDAQWLRTFLKLDARAEHLVPARDIERQEATVLRALALLEVQPGVVLADEVGMGKTYEALGVIAARVEENPAACILVLTPGPDLNTKWENELLSFVDPSRPTYRGFPRGVRKVKTLAGLLSALPASSVTIAPVTAFAGGRGVADQAYLLSLWARARALAGNQVAAIFDRYDEGGAARVHLERDLFLGEVGWDRMARASIAVLGEPGSVRPVQLDELFADRIYDTFRDKRRVDRALADLRFRLLGSLLPDVDLLVVDEAHKLKNAESVRATGVRRTFARKFDKALFLTATPFQLSVEELSQVFAMFAVARSAPPNLREQTERFLEKVREYTDAYGELERVWSMLDGAGAQDFADWYGRNPDLDASTDDPALARVAERAKRLLALKRDHIEPGLRTWMIRSLREDKRSYRLRTRHPLRAKGGQGVPFLLYERFIDEWFRAKQRTHKAAVQINMVSSFEAARTGALLASEVREGLEAGAEGYRKLLTQVVTSLRDVDGGHPKVDFVVQDALAAAMHGEKTLIFCSRRQTLVELRRAILSRWEEELLRRWRVVYPDAMMSDIFDEARVRGRHTRLQARFERELDGLHLALRERYVSTALGASDAVVDRLAAIVERANELVRAQRLRATHAERKDWSVAKRCIEQAVAQLLDGESALVDVDEDALRRLLHVDFISLGFDLEKDELESHSAGGDDGLMPTWTVDEADVRIVCAPVNLWALLKSPLVGVPADLRVRTVERLARYLVSNHVPFLPDLLAYAVEQGLDVETIEARALTEILDRFWMSSGGRPWLDRIRSFLIYASALDDSSRRRVLDETKAGAIVRHTVDGESRERLREAFNTPLYPMILVANEVMQEGLDLHHNCRRVVHHDLAWNPAQLEQRVGRVDRLGSLLQKQRAKAPETKLEILLPVIVNTIDERLERMVRLRERWLEFILGAEPRFDEYGLADAPACPLPEKLAESLRIELGPLSGQERVERPSRAQYGGNEPRHDGTADGRT